MNFTSYFYLSTTVGVLLWIVGYRFKHKQSVFGRTDSWGDDLWAFFCFWLLYTAVIIAMRGVCPHDDLKTDFIKVVKMEEITPKHVVVVYDDSSSESITDESELQIVDRMVSKTKIQKGFIFCGISFTGEVVIKKEYKK